MQQTISGFEQDEEKHWVAELSCGHKQHVRHDPPWQNRPWVITFAGRNEKLGTRLECKKCDMPRLPPKELLTLLNSSTKISGKGLPAELLAEEQLPNNIWYEISVLSGQIQLIFTATEISRQQGFLLDYGFSGIVPPQRPFKLKPNGLVELRILTYEEHR